MTPQQLPINRRPGLSLRFKVNAGLVFTIGVTFAGLNTFNVLANRLTRRAEILNNNETVARLIAGALLGELLDQDIHNTRIKRFLDNFLTAALTLNANNKELAFAVVVDADNHVVVGRAKTNLTVFSGNVTYESERQVLDEVARLEGKLGPNMSVKRFPLKVGDLGLVGKLMVGTSLARVEHDAQRELMINLGVFFVSLALLLTYSSVTLDRMVVRPILTVAHAMHNVQKGDLQHEINLVRTDEIGALATSFNFMIRGLRERERLKDAFHRYVSRQVYEKFQKGEIALRGETRLATVLFSDIRGFTTISEQLTPTEVVAMLNEYFNVMVPIVNKYDGFVNKFIGDAMMAVYNVPVDQSQHELRAVRTALEMHQALETLNQQRMDRGQPPLRIGIGVNTGPVVAGNIGHEQRLEYTVIGDAVNLAQRIEAHTKTAGVALLVSETTYAAVQDMVQATPLPAVRVKGKQDTVTLYSVTDLKTPVFILPPEVTTPTGDREHLGKA